jgi:hypothetical protein
MSATGKAVRAGKKVPQYRGREALEASVGSLVEPLARRMAGSHIQRLLGFWVLWHAAGGSIADMESKGALSRSGIYTQRKEFRQLFGIEVDDFLPMIGAQIRELEKRKRMGDDGGPESLFP